SRAGSARWGGGRSHQCRVCRRGRGVAARSPALNVAGSQAALFQISLVVFLSAIKLRSGRDFSDYRTTIARGSLKLALGSFSNGLLLRGMKEDGGAVLRAHVWTLAVRRGGIVHVPESLKQLLVRNLRRVIGQLHHFGVTSLIGANILIGRILGLAAQIAGCSIGNPWNLSKMGFHAPKATGAECGLLHRVLPLYLD